MPVRLQLQDLIKHIIRLSVGQRQFFLICSDVSITEDCLCVFYQHSHGVTIKQPTSARVTQSTLSGIVPEK